MATSANPPPGAFVVEDYDADPFATSNRDTQRQRYSAFDNSQFSLYQNGSPQQAKRALQAHLAETARRLQETSHLGNSLLQQQRELEERLQDVDKQQQDSEIGPELRQKLAELEREYNEVGRETARAFLPKSRVSSGETDLTTGGSVYSSEAHPSPSKISVPSRKQRNQQPSRINDIALATEISTSLLSQLKELQAVLLEKDEALKAANLDNSQLELEVEGLSQRLRTIDESESRLKDVNWNLETQVRDFEAQAKAALDKENRMNHSLSLAKSERSTVERELEDLKQLYAKLQDDQGSKSKYHETELLSLRRNVSMGETERGALQRKVEELASQNQELAKAVAYRMRPDDHATSDDTSPDDGVDEGHTMTPEHSPPPSPNKATPRHGQLESETLKHSLHHAHRMIQQLKNNIHREKTEKIELKRLLQDARDELETNRNSIHAPGSASKRRKNDKDIFKKPPRPDRLGAQRFDSQEVIVDDEEWEDHEILQATPSKRSRNVDVVPGSFPSGFSSAAETSTDDFETAHETSDAFETATERDGTATETDAFQTGVETLDGGSSDELTETEARPSTSGTVRIRRSSPTVPDRNAYESTASTSEDEDEDSDIRTPGQTHQPRFKLKMRQAGYRRSLSRAQQELLSDNSPAGKGSPGSVTGNSNHGTPQPAKSLLAELGALEGDSEDGSFMEGTPRRSSMLSLESSPEITRSVLGRSPFQSVPSKPAMVDSSMMTEPWPVNVAPELSISSISTEATKPNYPRPALSTISPLSTQNTEPQSALAPSLHVSSHSSQATEPKSALPPPLHVSSHSSQATEPKPVLLPPLQISSHYSLATEPISVLPPSLKMSTHNAQHTAPEVPSQPSLFLSSHSAQDTAPVHPPPTSLRMSEILARNTEPVSPVVAKIVPIALDYSSVAHQATKPLELPAPKEIPVQPLLMSSLSTQSTEPSEPSITTPDTKAFGGSSMRLSSLQEQATESEESPRQTSLQFSSLLSQATDPLPMARTRSQLSVYSSQTTEPVRPSNPARSLSALSSLATSPVLAHKPAPSQLSTFAAQATEPVEPYRPARSQLSTLSSLATSPVVAFKPAPSQLSGFTSQATEPTDPPRPTPHQLSVHAFQATEPVQSYKPTLLQTSVPHAQATEPVEPPRQTLSRDLGLSLQHTSPVEAVRPRNKFSSVVVLQDHQPESPILPAFSPSPEYPSTANRAPQLTLSFSSISSEDTEPSRPTTAQRIIPGTSLGTGASTQTEDQQKDKFDLGKLSFFNSVLPWDTAPSENNSKAEVSDTITRDGRIPLGPLAFNSVQAGRSPSPVKAVRMPTVDGGTQTMVSAETIDRLLAVRASQRHSGTLAAAGVEKSLSPPSSPRRNSNDRNPKRPGSSSSIRSRAASPPPLPAEYKQVIAAAALKSPQVVLPAPTTPGPATSPGAMGPPTLPASAYKKRPLTPTIRTNNLASSPKTGGTTPRPRYQSPKNDAVRSGASSPITRRSSMSSFASEVDHRLNIAGMPFAQTGLDPNKIEPRMIQAITQTMIGEFLWKYTRKAGRGGMSENRHRRFFWVHPYTRTLYWSEQDPATAGRAQLKAKSVAIESVQIVTDDNPFPPGLHRKSLIVTTPGRTIKFTAPTSQRHDTWFNSLSYLLRGADGEGTEQQQPEEEEIHNEFNPAYRSSSRQTGRSKASVTSNVTWRTSSPHHAEIPTLRHPTTPTPQRAPSTEPGPESGRFSSLSGMFRPNSALRNSFHSRKGRQSVQATGSEQPDERSSAHDLVQQLADQRVHDNNHPDEMVNVRACCDGKSD
jgi:predicted  nucleic acid-binding Zn-ribbon protein